MGTGPFGSIMSTAGIMDTPHYWVEGAPYFHHYLSLAYMPTGRHSKDQGQVRGYTLHSSQLRCNCNGDPGRLVSQSMSESATTGRAVECGNPDEIPFVSTGADRAKDGSAPSRTDERISFDGRGQSRSPFQAKGSHVDNTDSLPEEPLLQDRRQLPAGPGTSACILG